MRGPLSQKLLLFLTCILFTSAREIDIHIDLDSPKSHHHETPFLGPGPQQVPDHHAKLDFDSLTEGALVGNHGFLTWTDTVRVSCAGSLASSKPNAVLINQYNPDDKLTNPGFRIDNTTATFETFDLLSFYIAPIYEPKKLPPIEFNVSVIGCGPQPGRVLSRMVTICGPEWPQKIELEDFKEVASVTVEMTSQIAPTGGPFMPSFVMDDVHMFWRRVVHDDEL
ncbi:uncharacterized protein H6S33_007291 [Morchella sextelata]|uniref:uncharacterized protein n=1 Tax=Morchella sextelata TaxID=1174677 RepID=UPI001D04982A|nr:uncharacterized protein H6S33_007291 [Morchella sextelata]KAH0603632.1 hypothetical protein H6S33_007291 [Morchella sextelata]